MPLDITIYDRNDYIGGRSTTVIPYHDHDNETEVRTPPAYPSIAHSPEPVELGASIFVSVNRNLMSAAQDLNLNISAASRAEPSTSSTEIDPILNSDNEGPSTGIWNSQYFVFIERSSEGTIGRYRNMLRIIFRYGFLGPYRTINLVKDVIGRFLKMYDAPYFPFRDLTSVIKAVDLEDVTADSTLNLLKEAGVPDRRSTIFFSEKKNENFAWEIVQAASRVNYAQNLAELHGVAGMVSMAPTVESDNDGGVLRIEGGNWQIFAGMAFKSESKVKLGTRVNEVSPNYLSGGQLSGYKVATQATTARSARGDSENVESFDTVILAAPYHQADVEFNGLTHVPNDDPYVSLHVTLLVTARKLSANYFSTPDVPDDILTTLPTNDPENYGRQINGTGKIPFFSISTLRTGLQDPHCLKSNLGHECPTERLYKIFSSRRIASEDLDRLFITERENEDQPFSWLYRKVWLAYPRLKPRRTFEPLRLDDPEGESAHCGSGHGIYYTGAMDNFISTMETNSLMGQNVARLIVDGWTKDKSEESV